MKCPKCHYLSFDPEPRCRNCGFTLTLEEDLPLSRDRMDPEDLDVVDRGVDDEVGDDPAGDRPLEPWADGVGAVEGVAGSPLHDVTRAEVTRRLSPPRVPPTVTPPTGEEGRSRSVGTTELPLFVKEIPVSEPDPAPDVPVVPVTAPAKVVHAPRPQVAPPREKRPEARKLGPLDDDLLDVLNRLDRRERVTPAVVRDLSDEAGRGRRLGAAAFDAMFLGFLATAVVAMTLRWCGLGWTDWSALPRLPIGAFLLIVLLGYLLLFTSLGGQTLGKMAFGIRVVDAGDTGTDALGLGPGQALYREVIAVPGTLALGLGFWPALFGAGRAVHDRLAATRVVRA